MKKCFVLGLCLLLLFSGCGKKTVHTESDILSIVVKPIAYGEESRIFTFDFEVGIWTEWYSADVMPYDFAGNISEAGAYQEHEMSPKSMEDFRNAAAEAEFLNWKDSYTGGATMDGMIWEIVITFAGGETKTISCFHAYPMTWDDMGEAFSDLANMQILESVENR